MNFEEISKRMKKLGRDTITEVQRMNEVRQLNARVSEEKKRLNVLYREMGKKLYDMYKEAPLDGFEAEIHSIEERFSMIDLLQDQIRTVKGVTLCPSCNMEVSVNERFCSNCGARMPEVITIEDQEEMEAVEGEVMEEYTAGEQADGDAAEADEVKAGEGGEVGESEPCEAPEADAAGEGECSEAGESERCGAPEANAAEDGEVVESEPREVPEADVAGEGECSEAGESEPCEAGSR